MEHSQNHSAGNGTQNMVGNNGGQQNNGTVFNTTNIGGKQRNAPVPNDTSRSSRRKNEPVLNNTNQGKTRTEIRALIHEVKDAIENCMTKYVTKEQVAIILQSVKGFDPEVTKKVWDGLEESNPDYFKAYNARVVLCHQISKFNELLQQQAKLMEKQTAKSIASNSWMNGHMPAGPPTIPPLIGNYSDHQGSQSNNNNSQGFTTTSLTKSDVVLGPLNLGTGYDSEPAGKSWSTENNPF